jgi:hypothetical protein
MKTALLMIVCATLGLVGCATNHENVGSAAPAYETTTGRGYGMENNLGVAADPRGGWENWRYGGDTSRITPRLPYDDRAVPPTTNP